MYACKVGSTASLREIYIQKFLPVLIISIGRKDFKVCICTVSKYSEYTLCKWLQPNFLSLKRLNDHKKPFFRDNLMTRVSYRIVSQFKKQVRELEVGYSRFQESLSAGCAVFSVHLQDPSLYYIICLQCLLQGEESQWLEIP